MITDSTPSPTPYDIVPIPTFPFIPPLWFWLSVAIVAAITLLLNKFITNRTAKVSIKKFDLLKNEIERNLAVGLDSVTASRISLMLKRFLSSESQTLGSALSTLPALSAHEIQGIANETLDSSVKEILQVIMELDSVRFQNCKNQPDLGRNLLNLIKELKAKFSGLKQIRGKP